MSSKLAWDDFRLIKAITDHGGLTGAAAALSVNHSTVFRRLGQIEEMVGMPLFERRKFQDGIVVVGRRLRTQPTYRDLPRIRPKVAAVLRRILLVGSELVIVVVVRYVPKRSLRLSRAQRAFCSAQLLCRST